MDCFGIGSFCIAHAGCSGGFFARLWRCCHWKRRFLCTSFGDGMPLGHGGRLCALRRFWMHSRQKAACNGHCLTAQCSQSALPPAELCCLGFEKPHHATAMHARAWLGNTPCVAHRRGRGTSWFVVLHGGCPSGCSNAAAFAAAQQRSGAPRLLSLLLTTVGPGSAQNNEEFENLVFLASGACTACAESS